MPRRVYIFHWKVWPYFPLAGVDLLPRQSDEGHTFQAGPGNACRK